MKSFLSMLKSYMKDSAGMSRQWNSLIDTRNAIQFSKQLSGQKVQSKDQHQSPRHDNPLQRFFNQENHNVIWKWHHYFDIYHRHLNQFRNKSIDVLEVGVYAGGSLQMWRDYFGPECHLIGVDINQDCKHFESENTEIHIGNQSDREFWRQLTEIIVDIDVFIDDGGHQPAQQIISFEEILMKIKPGGIYICEDVLGLDNSYLDYIHGLIKSLNIHESANPDYSVKTSHLQQKIKSIHVYPYMVIIEMNQSSPLEFIAEQRG